VGVGVGVAVAVGGRVQRERWGGRSEGVREWRREGVRGGSEGVREWRSGARRGVRARVNMGLSWLYCWEEQIVRE
jgi:hypothetical protein